MSRKIVIVALVAAMVLTLTGLAWADDGDANPEGQRAGYLQQGIMQQLTPEQREELHSTIAEMLKGWGIKASPLGAGPLWGQQAGPSRWGQSGLAPHWGQQAGPPRWGQQAGPPRWGQQAGPPHWGQQAGPPGWGQPAPPPYWGWGQQAGPPHWGQPAPPPYWGWGQQAAPPRWGQQQQSWRGQQGLYGQGAQRPGWQLMMQRLTPEQREEVRATVKELHEEGVEPQEIREAVRDMFKGWDIEPR